MLTDRRPDEPDQRSRDGQPAAAEEWTDALTRELVQLPLDDLASRQFRVWHLIRMSTDSIENVLRKPRLRLVEVRNAVDDGDGLPLPAAREQELWRFEEVEEEEAADEHREGDGAERDGKVSPA